MKVILTSDVEKLGKSGDLKDVAEGFARNFLIPQKLAVPAAGGAYRAWQHDIASREEKRKREREEAEIAATRIATLYVPRVLSGSSRSTLWRSMLIPRRARASAMSLAVIDP